MVGRQLVERDVLGAVGAQVDLLGQHLADVVLVGLEGHGGVGQRGGSISAGSRPSRRRMKSQATCSWPSSMVQVELPQRLDAPVALVLQHRPVQVDLVVLVAHPHREPRVERVEQRLVVGDVLLFDEGDLGVEATGDRLDPVGPVVHVEVHGLLLGRHDGHDVHAGQRVNGVGLEVRPDLVVGVAVLGHRRAARRDLGQVLGDLVGAAPVQQVVEVAVAVQVVEVLEQGEVEGLVHHRVGLVSGEPGRQVDRHLLVADRGLEGALVAGVEPVDGLLLLGVDPAVGGEGPLQLEVVGVSGELVGEQDRLDLDPVHEDHPRAGVGVDGVLFVRRDVELGPVAELLLDGDSRLLEGVERHRYCLSIGMGGELG